MKKWIVRVQYNTDYANDVCFIYAKNAQDVENIMGRLLEDYIDIIDGYEYEQFKVRNLFNYKWQKKNPYSVYISFGHWMGVESIKETLENGK